MDKLIKVSQGISFHVEQPKIFSIRDDRPSAYSEFLEDILSKQSPQLIFCILPNNRSDRYSAIKKKCCVDRPIPSQVYLQKNIAHKNVMSIATKVAIQMNCKLGGAPWRVDIPLDGLMVVGFDVCHDVTNPGKDYGKRQFKIFYEDQYLSFNIMICFDLFVCLFIIICLVNSCFNHLFALCHPFGYFFLFCMYM